MPRSVYLDASAIVKLVVSEEETDALREFIDGADLVSSEIVEIEVPRAAFLRSARPASLIRLASCVSVRAQVDTAVCYDRRPANASRRPRTRRSTGGPRPGFPA